MGWLERWDQRNQRWADASRRDPDARSGVRVIAVLGMLYALVTGVAVVLEEWLVAAVAAVKAQVFLTVSLVVSRMLARRRREAAERP